MLFGGPIQGSLLRQGGSYLWWRPITFCGVCFSDRCWRNLPILNWVSILDRGNVWRGRDVALAYYICAHPQKYRLGSIDIMLDESGQYLVWFCR